MQEALTEYTETMLSAWNALVALGVPLEVATLLCERLGPFCQGEACRVPDGRAAEVMRRLVQNLTAGAARSTRDRERTASALLAVAEERERQRVKWGDEVGETLCLGFGIVEAYTLRGADAMRDRCDRRHRDGVGSRADVLLEEVAELFEAVRDHGDDSAEAEGEAVQVTAVGAKIVEDIRRRREERQRTERHGPVVESSADARVTGNWDADGRAVE